LKIVDYKADENFMLRMSHIFWLTVIVPEDTAKTNSFVKNKFVE